jgi:hypothetical protein
MTIMIWITCIVLISASVLMLIDNFNDRDVLWEQGYKAGWDDSLDAVEAKFSRYVDV